ncbi:flavin reductase family protein [uncultured Tateyamaria sp.]|uniref:flavin reductase family protein n=1 Tax=uncultured Tateyamaria sp. TaxID=455651 RepID=UPI0026050917|nr:flavin reductase family protein [uncultured Tateyamaria sp.]
MTQLDRRALRSAFGSFMTGVTVVTMRRSDGTARGFTANSFTSVSLDPPLVLVCPGHHLSSFQDFSACRHFAISVLAEGQEDISNAFASSKADRFGVAPHHDDASGVPVIEGAVSTFSCRTYKAVPAGDHVVLIGEVMAFEHRADLGLGFANGGYFSLGLERAALTDSAKSTIGGVIIAFGDSVLLDKTDAGYQPPSITCRDRASIRSDMTTTFGPIELGPVYSIFDDPDTRAHYTFVRATARQTNWFPDLEPIHTARLPTLSYASPAINHMMTRYAEEAQNRDFGLYLGDATHGDVHTIS